ncbi:MAG: carboxypeptidase regulatory-like domain-containing protein, partial [Candidatus Desantisbacteria bacterium]
MAGYHTWLYEVEVYNNAGSISGKVTEWGGTIPNPNVLVEALQGTVTIGTATTDAYGSYSISVAKGTYTMRASKPQCQFVSTQTTVVVSPGTTTYINLIVSFPIWTSPADNLALHADTSASDNGWGGGSSKTDLTDGMRVYGGEWARGLAFQKGWSQVTLDFGKTITYDRVMSWWHDGSAESHYCPQAYRIENWNGTSWVEIFSTTNPVAYLKYPDAVSSDWWYDWSAPTENTFSPVTGSKVRLWSYPKDGEVMAGYHVWLYEVEVYNDAGSVPLLDVSTTSLPSCTVNTYYSAALTATGGTPPYKWSLYANSLPAGLSLSESGLISGTPTQFGSFTFTAQVT